MGFGRNPYVPKAQVAEQKAQEATDDRARSVAHNEAAREWDRAAEREKPGKLRTEYEANAVRNRELAGLLGDRRSRQQQVRLSPRLPRALAGQKQPARAAKEQPRLAVAGVLDQGRGGLGVEGLDGPPLLARAAVEAHAAHRARRLDLLEAQGDRLVDPVALVDLDLDERAHDAPSMDR